LWASIFVFPFRNAKFCGMPSQAIVNIIDSSTSIEKVTDHIYYICAHDSVRREALYNILIEFGIPRKLVGLITLFS
jgi:hypothetical protein